ncbi:MAG TPA: protein kinase, partial [Trebonia sp.]|nr:protein kinase [Trebonia sp.]
MESGTELAGRYRLDRRLGVGGMGEVWQARDLKFERDLDFRRDVAIKLMHPTLSGSDMLRRFQLEAKILSKLNHPHIVRMLDADWHEGQLFIVMELLAGQDLGQLLSAQPRGLPVGRAVELARQLATGLSAVHSRGIVHRDLKPANLFVLPGNLLKIGDFGVARDSSATSVLTAHGVIMGTWAYIAPERWLGTWDGQPSADLYSTGCILYELLTGETPFSADSMAIIRMHCEEIPQPPQARNHDIPEPLNKLVLRLLAKDPADRPETAAQVADALTEIKDDLARTGTGATAAATPAATAAQQSGSARPRAARTGGVRVTAPIACLSLSRDHRHFFVLAGTRSLKHRTYWPSQAWTTWHDMKPLPPGNAVAIAAQAYGDHQKVAVAAGDSVYTRWRVGNPGGGWSAWDAMPGLGAPVIDLAFSPVAAGHWEVLAVDEYETIHLSSWRESGAATPGWSEWTALPAPEGLPVTAIAASCASLRNQDQAQYQHQNQDHEHQHRVAGHRQDLVTLADGRVWHSQRQGAPDAMPAWSDWAPLPGVQPQATDVACSSRGPGHVEVFAVDSGGQVSRRDYTERDGWSGWQDLPAPAGQRAAAITSTSHPFSPYQKLAL